MDPPAAGALWAAIQHNRRAPLQYARPRFNLKTVWHWFKRIYTVRESDPKAAFPVESWKYIVGGDPALGEMFRHGSGFVFEFRLAAGENAHHVVRSVQSQKKSKERLVVVASASEAANPDATVRCLAVDAETLRLTPTDPRYAMVQSAAQPKGGGPRVFTQKQGDVPDDALCLTHPDPRAAAPSWGGGAGQRSSGAPPPPLNLADEDGDDDLREARRQARRRRRNTIAKHAAFWAYWFAASVYFARTSEDGGKLLWQWLGGSLFVLFLAVLGAVVVAAVREALVTAHWFGGRNGPKSAWTGGTVTAAELGAMIGGRGEVPGKIWGRYVGAGPRTATGEPALLKELGDKHLGLARLRLQDAIKLTEHGQNIYWDLSDLLVEADKCIPGPGLHTDGWAGDEALASPDLEEYRAVLEPLRYRKPLREVYKCPVDRLHVVQAARSHLRPA